MQRKKTLELRTTGSDDDIGLNSPRVDKHAVSTAFPKKCFRCVVAHMAASAAAAASRGPVKFHDVNDPSYGSLSVLSPHPIVVRHVTYPSVYHFFLCERFKGTGVEEEIRGATSLWEVDRQVRRGEANGLQREDWDRVKADVMLLGNYYKFKQNPDTQGVLLQTGQRPLIDHTPTDAYWGDGSDGRGKNLLGIVLMAVRKRISYEDAKAKKTGGASKRNFGR